MAELLKALKSLAEESRLRILRLLVQEELSVAELQEILGMGQSRISMALSQLRQAGLVELRKSGQKSLYRFAGEPALRNLVEQTGRELDERELDDDALALILNRRKDSMRAYFDELAGRFGRNYVPGRSWKALAEMLLALMPPLTIADIGAGEGTLALLLSKRAAKVYAIDNSEKMVAYGREVAQRAGALNLEYLLGDLEQNPLPAASVDLAVFSQSLHHALHPQQALREAHRILRPGGRLVILDLHRHSFEQARELYADLWLGFGQAELLRFAQEAGFTSVEVSLVHREEAEPFFETVLLTATRT
ncbi:MAG: metalloregulator ArsR/SmtB family transcription factor [Bryobacter sp.]|nr:metalloregulator ArsR/SmtB family transcription factor [Bryobacter sp.]